MDMSSKNTSWVAGVILTGGASTRMGKDKATLIIEGQSCSSRLAKLLTQSTNPCLEVGPGHSGLDFVLEDPPFQGPLVALALAKQELEKKYNYLGPVVVLACDLPFVTNKLISLLVNWPSDNSVIPILETKPQPLCARFSKDSLEIIQLLVQEGKRSIKSLFDRTKIDWIDETKWSDQIDRREFLDIDTPLDIQNYGIKIQN